MSPKSRGRRRDQRRPSDRRRAQHRAASDPIQTFVNQVMRESTHLLDGASPLDVESFVSSAIGVWWSNPAGAGLGTALVGRAQQLGTPEAAALLHGLAVLAEPGLSEAARAALDDLDAGLDEPSWADAVGRAKVRECFTVDDVLGDASQVIMTFAYAEEDPHAMVVLVDHNLGGLAKDIWIADDSPALLDQVRSTVDDDADLRLATAEPSTVKPLLLAALATADASVDPPVSDTFRQLRAMLAARVRALPDGGTLPEPPEWTEEQREEFVRDFVSAPEAKELDAAAAEAVAVEIVGYGCDHDRGQPLRVSTTKLEVFLMGWLPLTGLLDDEYVEYVPSVVPAWVRYAARRTSLADSTVTEILDGIEEFTATFREAYDDPERWGPARTAVASILTDIDPERDDADDVFARRMFAVAEVPGPDFDPDDEDAFLALAEREHPEYAEVFTDPSADPVVDGVNARLHAATHTVVARQLWFDDPPQVWATGQRLLDAGYDRHDVLHALTFALSTQIHRAVSGAPPGDDDGYTAALEALPQSWERAAESPVGDG